MCCRVRHRPVSRANPRSPRQGVTGSGIGIGLLSAGRLLHGNADADAGAVVTGVSQGGQPGRGGRV